MKNNKNTTNREINPVVTYPNSWADKAIICKDNYTKSGIYRWNNLITGKSYVGSSINLGRRFNFYYSINSIKKVINKESSIIYSALVKYNYNSFSLDILEYCKPNDVVYREQHYLDLLKPAYNILKIANSRIGHKLSEQTKKAISFTLRSRRHPNEFIVKDKLIIKLKKEIKKESKLITNITNNRSEIITDNTRLKLSLRSQGVTVKVFDNKKNLINQFPSMTSAAKHYGFSLTIIKRIFNTGISYDDYSYKFETKDLRIWVCDSNNKLISILDNAKKVSIQYNIPPATLSYYIKSGKLYLNKLYFYNINSKSNYYLG